MNDARGRDDANRCFVCGPDNPQGLQLSYRLDGEICRASFTPAPHHGGYDGQTHGGILFSVLDDVMANWFFLRGERAHTARCAIRYREPVPTGTPLQLEGRLLRRKGRLAVLEGRALRAADGVLVADAEGTFMLVPGGRPPAGQAMSGGGDS